VAALHDRDRRYRGGRGRVYDDRGRYYEPRRISRRDRMWRGNDGRYYCKRDNGTTGLVIGAGVGALAGHEIAGRGAMREVADRSGIKLLEPIMKVEVVTPEDYLGDVIGDLNSRRGQIQGTDTRGNAQAVEANVPLANMFGYVNELRSFTQGRAQYSMQFSHYDEVPEHIARELIAAYEKAKADGEQKKGRITKLIGFIGLERIEILRKAHVRRANLYYLRERTGKRARLREKRRAFRDGVSAAQAEENEAEQQAEE
jgi:hypothetical protein